MSEEFKLDDPTLLDYVPEAVDPNAEPAKSLPPKPPFGTMWVILTLKADTENAPSVYAKKMPDGRVKILAKCNARVMRPDGTPGQFLRDFYPSSEKNFEQQEVADLVYIARLAGSQWPNKSIGDNMKFVRELFEKAGDEGIKVPAFVNWYSSEPMFEADGVTPVIDPATQKQLYKTLESRKAIEADALLRGVPLDEAHLYLNKDGEIKSITSQIKNLKRADEVR